MTVKFIEPGTLSSGFTGYRVVVSMGTNGLVVQEYFSTKSADQESERKRAYSRNAELEAIRDQINQEDRLYRVKANHGPEIIAPGFRCAIIIKTKRGKSYSHPAFVVDTIENGKRRPYPVTFNPDSMLSAFNKALQAYAREHDISADDKAILRERMPSPRLFSEYLIAQAKERGQRIDVQELKGRVSKAASSAPGIPSYREFQEAIALAKTSPATVKFFCDHLFIFRRVSIEKYFYAAYRYDECNSVMHAVELALNKFNQFVLAEKRLKESSEAPQGPADFIKLHRSNEGAVGTYTAAPPGVPPRRFAFNAAPGCADGQLHAYRTALQYCALAYFYDVQMEADKWKYRRLYQGEKPLLPLGFWERTAPLSNSIVKSNIVESIKDQMREFDISLEDIAQAWPEFRKKMFMHEESKREDIE